MPLNTKEQPNKKLILHPYVSIFIVLLLVGCNSVATSTTTIQVASTTGSSTQTKTQLMTATSLPTQTWMMTMVPLTQTPTMTLKPTQVSTIILEIGSSEISSMDGMLMVDVPAGEFKMGRDPLNAKEIISF